MLQSQVTDVIAVIQEKAMKENSRNLYAVLFSKISVGFATFLFLTLFCSNFAQANVRTNRQTQAEMLEQEIDDQSKPSILSQTTMKWIPAPLKLPPGAEVAILSGKPDFPGPFTLQIKIPAGYKIPAHWQYSDEFITVLSGNLHVGMGDRLDQNKARIITAGGFARIPAKMHHYGFTTEDTVLQIHGIGPWGMKYINPSDDPNPDPEENLSIQPIQSVNNSTNNHNRQNFNNNGSNIRNNVSSANQSNPSDYRSFNALPADDNSENFDDVMVGNYNNDDFNDSNDADAMKVAHDLNKGDRPSEPERGVSQNKVSSDKMNPTFNKFNKKFAHTGPKNVKNTPGQRKESIHEVMEEDRASIKRK